MLTDHTFIFWTYVATMSCTSVASRATNRPVNIPTPILLAYNAFNSAANLYIFWGLAPYVCNGTVGFGVEDNETVRHFVYLHYLTKYLDFLDTFFMILRHKWDQANLLQLYHHSTVGVLWKWVYEDFPTTLHTTYSFGAAVNSFVHSLMYLHYFMAAIGVKNPYKRYMTGLQMCQFVACIMHAGAVWINLGSNNLWVFPAVQIYYMCSMLGLFGCFVHKTSKKSMRDATNNNTHSKETHSKATRNKATHNKETHRPATTPLKIRIHGTTYDATEFAKTHPGGNIICKYSTLHVPDATDAFNNFHIGSKRAMAMLRALPREEQDGDARTLTDFQQMIESWKSRGLYQGGQLEFTLWAAAVAVGVATALHLLGRGHPVWGGVVAGFAWGQCGFIQHHAGHLAFSGNPRIDFLIQALYESLAKGGSGRWWRNRHNKHHAMPNSIEHDGDLRTTPFFAWDGVLIKKVPTLLLRVQHLLFLPMLAIYVPVLATSVFGFVVRRGYWDELGLMVMHFRMVTRFSSDVSHLLFFYFIGYCIQGIYLGCMFGLSHYTMPRVETTDNHDWASWQYTTTCNWGVNSRFASYFSGFLNLQIEHHIAVKMPPENYHLIVDDTRAYAGRHALPYLEVSFWRAISNMFGGLRDTGCREYIRRMERKRQ